MILRQGLLLLAAPSWTPLRASAPLLRAHHKLGRIQKKRQRWPRISMIGKSGRKKYYKGTGSLPGLGSKSAGTWDAKGLYRLQEKKLRTFVIPKPPFDHSLRPYVAKNTILTSAVQEQWPSRYKVTEQVGPNEYISRDLPFDHKVDGHYLLQLGQYFAGIRSLDDAALQQRSTRILAELRESVEKVQPSTSPATAPSELKALDPHIETPSEVMKGEQRKRAERNKVARDLEIEASEPDIADRDTLVTSQEGAEWTGEIAVPPRDWVDAAWSPHGRKRPARRRRRLRSVAFGRLPATKRPATATEETK